MYDFDDGVQDGSPQTFMGPHARERQREHGSVDESGLVIARNSPVLHAFVAVVTLAVTVLLFIAAMPGEERTLVYQGEIVSAGDLCESTGADGEIITRACSELGTWETYPSGWSVVPVVIALVLAAGAGFEIYQVPKLIRSRKQRRQNTVSRMVERDYKRT
jgi:hypothetical protein